MSSKAYFEAVAGEWDAMRGEFFQESVREKAIQAADLAPGMVAADIGAGSGFISEGLARYGDYISGGNKSRGKEGDGNVSSGNEGGVKIVAVDQSPAMLEEIRRKLSAVPNLDLRQGEADSLPLADEEADRVFANMYLHHVEHPAAAIAEMTRILKPGGRLVLTDVDAHDHRWLLEEHHDRWMGFQHKEILGWFVAAGLRNVSVVGAGED